MCVYVCVCVCRGGGEVPCVCQCMPVWCVRGALHVFLISGVARNGSSRARPDHAANESFKMKSSGG